MVGGGIRQKRFLVILKCSPKFAFAYEAMPYGEGIVRQRATLRCSPKFAFAYTLESVVITTEQIYTMENDANEMSEWVGTNPFILRQEQERLDKLCGHIFNLTAEVTRLKKGDFTAIEFQNLCHSLGDDCKQADFESGCAAYQKKLFGSCERDRLLAKVAELQKSLCDAREWAARLEKVVMGLLPENRVVCGSCGFEVGKRNFCGVGVKCQ